MGTPQAGYVVGPRGEPYTTARAGAGAAINAVQPVTAGHVAVFADDSGYIVEDGGPLPGSGTYGVVNAAGGAASLNFTYGRVTSEALTTGPGSIYALTLTNTLIQATSIVTAEVDQGSNTTEGICVTRISVTHGQVVIVIQNLNFVDPFNGTIVIAFGVLR